ncbi:eukaryotic translation initiation factor 3 subunit H-B-like isoform X1 [Electrophorus electricus]|uniref:eukaryotic translation initiation factor 3 subunit H-B-like isoform X1 n=1 Tax=Electrophorus electricus TaxID=8005 RepID=UPI0015D0349F|nr:eukaryotic translation initiation factor 3 subunit H-B-like isoform X1 [Electrophorus electricus]
MGRGVLCVYVNVPSTHLEKSLQMLMDRVDDMSQEIVKYNDYSRRLRKQQQKHQYIQRRQQENAQRQSRGEALLPEDHNKLFKPPVPPLHMDTLLISGQINMYCQTLKEFTSQNLGKIFMAEALQSHGS